MALAKLSAPKLTRPLERKRLYRALDEARERQVVWIGASAGSGKTTLAATYAAARRLSALWYRIDEDDSDPTTFFHYLGEVVRRTAPRHRRRALPRLTPELLPGKRAFARNFARQMFSRLPPAALLVLDDYQEMSADSSVHELLATVIQEAPREFGLMVISRGEPPAALAQLAAYERLAVLGAEAILFTEDEARAFVAMRGEPADARQVRERWERSLGWIAGFILLSEPASAMPGDAHEANQVAAPHLFDYFAAQILHWASPELQQFLLRSSVLVDMTVQMAAALTGNPRAPQVLADLAQRHYFTVRHRGGGYRYHPLFREFLLNTAERVLGVKEFGTLRAEAARILEEAGELERAAEAYAELCDWEALARVLHTLAPGMQAQGRLRIALNWLEPLSEETLRTKPWLCFWRAAALLAAEPRRAISEFERVWEQFLDGGDMRGAYLAWTSAVEGLLFMHDFELLEPWVLNRQRLAPAGLESIPPLMQVRFVAALFHAMYVVRSDDAEIAHWERRAIEMLEWDVPPEASLHLGIALLLRATYYGPGETRAARIVARVAPAAALPDASPLLAYAWYALAPQYFYWYDEDPGYQAMRACIRAWEDLALKHELHAMRHIGYVHALLKALADGELDSSATALAALDGVQHLGKEERSFHEWLRAWYWNAKGNAAATTSHAEASVQLAEECRLATTIAPTLAMLGMARAKSGASGDANLLLGRARRMARRCGMGWVECLSLLASATLALQRGRTARAMRFLRPGLAIAARERFMRLAGLIRPDLERLAAAALENGIETEYVRAVIRCRRLSPPRAAPPQGWPWPIAVRCMGAFEVAVDGKPVRFGRKTPRKPLDLLKVLIAHRGEATEARICSILWPDLDMRAARAALATAIHRLRAILGERGVITGEQRIRLDRDWICTDAWSFEILGDKAERDAHPGERDAILAGALELYRGEFLSGEEQPWAVSARERLRARFLRGVAELARAHGARGDWREALNWYRRGLDIDELVEEFHHGLIDAYAALGYRAEAIAAYRRCQRTLSKVLGVAPSHALQERYRALIDA